MHFENCASHTELKINDRGIFIIETSPRLGGDYITSTLVPLSTGINIEDQLLNIALGNEVDSTAIYSKCSGIRFFSFTVGDIVRNIPDKRMILKWSNVMDYSFNLSINDSVNNITSSLNRYGYIILQTDDYNSIDVDFNNYENKIKEISLN